MKKVWFFDLDGTLADTDRDIRESWKAAMRDIGVSAPNFDRDFVAGPPIEEMAKKLFGEKYSDELGLALRVGFGKHYDNDGFPNTVEYPGIIEAVRSLKNSGAKVIIATNKRYVGAKLMAKKFGWDEIFDGLYAGDMYKDEPKIGKLKKAELLRMIMQKLGVAGEDCVMVGDTQSDFDAAKANNMESIAVAWGYGTKAEIDEATRIAYTANELNVV